MKIAILSDIHGNSFALQKVLEEAKQLNVGKVLVLGDIVGYYYHPNLVLEMLEEWDHELITGNHETFLKKVISNDLSMDKLKDKYGNGHHIALERLSSTQLDKLLNAPEQNEVVIDQTKILMCHGSNWDADYYLYPDTDIEVLNQTNEPNVDFVVVGHSHYSFVHRNETNILINVGSVGQSRRKGGVANWAIIDSIDRSFQLMATKYDVLPLIKEVELIDPNKPYLKNILKRNNDES